MKMMGKPWTIDSKHMSYSEADDRRKKLLKAAKNLSVKVKKYADGSFAVKTRAIVTEEIKKAKKNKQKKLARRAKRSKAE